MIIVMMIMIFRRKKRCIRFVNAVTTANKTNVADNSSKSELGGPDNIGTAVHHHSNDNTIDSDNSDNSSRSSLISASNDGDNDIAHHCSVPADSTTHEIFSPMQQPLSIGSASSSSCNNNNNNNNFSSISNVTDDLFLPPTPTTLMEPSSQGSNSVDHRIIMMNAAAALISSTIR